MKKYIGLSIIALSMGLASCNDYLDKLPDDRAEVNTTEKVNQLLVSAYPDHSPSFLFWMSSDDVDDNGKAYTAQLNQEQMYRWQNVEGRGNDDPRTLWNNYYEKCATANEALAAIDAMGNPASMAAQRAEALLCRAFSMFMCANTFCMAYDPQKADEYMGIPYPKTAGTSVNERGTLRETYENIAADIEAALPYVNEDHLLVPKYHWNQKAANAFAARFYLYYHDYDKTIQYATACLGSNPVEFLHMLGDWSSLGATDFFHAFKNSAVPANFIFMPAYSTCGRATSGSTAYKRFGLNRIITLNEMFWIKTPWWGSGSSANVFWPSHKLYGPNQNIRFPVHNEEFEYTDKVNGTGYAHTLEVPFQGEETLLCRAEAYALKGDFANAIADMNTWAQGFTAESYIYTSGGKRYIKRRTDITQENLDNFFKDMYYSAVTPDDGITSAELQADPTLAAKQRWIKKTLHPQGFTVAEGTQENCINLILWMRRVSMPYQGIRFQDLKRYGIEYTHFLDGEDPIVFKAGDLRGAIQLPDDVIKAGLPENPREEASTATTGEE